MKKKWYIRAREERRELKSVLMRQRREIKWTPVIVKSEKKNASQKEVRVKECVKEEERGKARA